MLQESNCSEPLKTLSEVLSWKAKEKYPTIIARTVSVSNNNGPKVLLCHDMMGGYLADRFDAGCYAPDVKGFGFSYWHWLSVDVFVYFSHEFVTIPPRSWIESAKTNGVKILGTVITEFDDGFKIWKEEMNSVDVIEQFADKLTLIASHYGFDGWLLNIENKVPEQAEMVLCLVQKLTHKVHALIPGSMVIWYDSVTYPKGNLDWQNELNNLNEAFFNECDGIFLNYTWTDDNLANSVALAANKNRLHDVYVGVDVFGRNCFGGGGFNTKAAVEKAVEFQLSVAIFAFGWVYETLPPSDFLANQQKFWRILSSLLPIKKRYLVPFSAEFCTGAGKCVFWLGEKCKKNSWYNLSIQSPCHLLSNGCHLTDHKNAFIGGCCLEFLETGNHDLFPIHFPKPGHYNFCVAFKLTEGNASFVVISDVGAEIVSLHSEHKDDVWVLRSKSFYANHGPGIIRVTCLSSSLLVGYIGIFNASQATELSYDEIVEQLRNNTKLYKTLIC